MDRRLRKSPARLEERLHRFLRPGALARLRDSKIIARSLRSAAISRLSPPSSPAPATTPRSPAAAASAAAVGENGVPHFIVTRASGAPRYPLRKKLAAAKAVLFVPPSPPRHEVAEMFLDTFGSSDLVAAR